MVSRRKKHTFQPAWRWDRAWSGVLGTLRDLGAGEPEAGVEAERSLGPAGDPAGAE